MECGARAKLISSSRACRYTHILWLTSRLSTAMAMRLHRQRRPLADSVLRLRPPDCGSVTSPYIIFIRNPTKWACGDSWQLTCVILGRTCLPYERGYQALGCENYVTWPDDFAWNSYKEHIPLPTAISRWIYRFSSDHRSQAASSPVSTWMGDRLGIPGAVDVLALGRGAFPLMSFLLVLLSFEGCSRVFLLQIHFDLQILCMIISSFLVAVCCSITKGATSSLSPTVKNPITGYILAFISV